MELRLLHVVRTNVVLKKRREGSSSREYLLMSSLKQQPDLGLYSITITPPNIATASTLVIFML